MTASNATHGERVISSTDTSDFTTLTAGTIVISSTPATATWSGAYSNLLPGASATADVNVANTGTAGLVYAIAGTASVDTVVRMRTVESSTRLPTIGTWKRR